MSQLDLVRRQRDEHLAELHQAHLEIERLRALLAEAPGITGVRVALINALEHWRWCWDCGTTDQDCRSTGRPCCPDCRHRDMGNLALARVLGAPGGES
jgi:NADH pyrophosphatase NudC (nudix superfamily)